MIGKYWNEDFKSLKKYYKNENTENFFMKNKNIIKYRIKLQNMKKYKKCSKMLKITLKKWSIKNCKNVEISIFVCNQSMIDF